MCVCACMCQCMMRVVVHVCLLCMVYACDVHHVCVHTCMHAYRSAIAYVCVHMRAGGPGVRALEIM